MCGYCIDVSGVSGRIFGQVNILLANIEVICVCFDMGGKRYRHALGWKFMLYFNVNFSIAEIIPLFLHDLNLYTVL